MVLPTIIIAVALAILQPEGPTERKIDRVGEITIRLQAPSLPIGERGRLMDEAISIYGTLATTDDPRWPTWATEAAALHLQRLALDGTDSIVIVGLPSDAQRSRAAATATTARDLIFRVCDHLLDDEEANSSTLALRVNLLGERAELIIGASVPTGKPQPMRRWRTRSLAPGTAESARRVTSALRVMVSTGPTSHAFVRQDLTELLSGDAEFLPQTHAEAQAALLRVNIHGGATWADIEASVRSLFVLSRELPKDQRFASNSLLVEAVARAYLDMPRVNSPVERFTAAVKALETLTDWMDSPEIARAWAIEKLSWRASELTELDGTPLLAVLARARFLERQSERLAAASVLATAAARFDGHDRLDAMRARLRLLMIEAEAARSKQLSIDAITLGLEMHREFPDATGHLESCLIIAKTLTTRADTDDADFKRFGQWLDVGLANSTALGELDYWRFQRGDYRAARATTITHTFAALQDFDAVDPESPIRELANARFREIAVAALAQASTHAAELRKQEDADALARFSTDQWLPLARTANDWAERSLQEPLPAISRGLADAMVEAKVPGAEATYRRLIATAEPASAEALELSLGMARALLLADKSDQAFALLRDVATGSDSPTADGQARPDRYWHAWTLMLETLLEQDDSPRQRTAIRTRLTQLESVDAALGGPPWNRRLGRIREAVGN